MLTVTFTETGGKLSLRLEGHAGYAEAGQDIVCASASILAYTLASIVDAYGYEVDPNISMESGDTIIECHCKDTVTFCKVADAYYYAKRGYALLAHNYPQYVRLES